MMKALSKFQVLRITGLLLLLSVTGALAQPSLPTASTRSVTARDGTSQLAWPTNFFGVNLLLTNYFKFVEITNGAVILYADWNAAVEDGSPDGAADYVLVRDATDGNHKKVLLNNLPAGAGTITMQTNHVDVGAETRMNFMAGANITLTATNFSGTNVLWIASTGGGGGGGPGSLDFNANQFDTNSIVDIVSGALVTNLSHYGNLNLAQDSATLRFGAASDVIVTRDAANQLAMRNGATPQLLHIYDTYTDGSNFERLEIGAVSGTFRIIANDEGSGSAQIIRLGINIPMVELSTAGDWRPSTDGLRDLGDSTLRWVHLWAIGTNFVGTLNASNIYMDEVTADRVAIIDANSQLTNSTAITPAELAFLDNINQNIQVGLDNLEGATNGLTTRLNGHDTDISNLQGATNGLTTRATNLEGATNGLTARVDGHDTDIGNLQGATNGLNTAVLQRQIGSFILSNFVAQLGMTNVNAMQFTVTDGVLTLIDSALATNLTLYSTTDIPVGSLLEVNGNARINGDLFMPGSSEAGINTAFVTNSLNLEYATADRVAVIGLSQTVESSGTIDTAELGYLDNISENIAVALSRKVETNYNTALGTNFITHVTDVGTPASGDLLAIVDVSTAERKYVSIGNLPTGGGGEANNGSNLGGGVGVFAQKSGVDLEFNTLNLNQFASNANVIVLKDAALLTNTSIRFGPNLPHLTTDRVLLVNAQGYATNAQNITAAELDFLDNINQNIQVGLDNLEGATNGLTTRVDNLDGATNGITTRLDSIDATLLTKVETNFNTALGTNFITGVADVGTPANGDLLPIVDVSTAQRKFVSIGNLPSGGGSPAGADFMLQYYNGGSFSAVSNLMYDPGTGIITVSNHIGSGELFQVKNGTGSAELTPSYLDVDSGAGTSARYAAANAGSILGVFTIYANSGAGWRIGTDQMFYPVNDSSYDLGLPSTRVRTNWNDTVTTTDLIMQGPGATAATRTLYLGTDGNVVVNSNLLYNAANGNVIITNHIGSVPQLIFTDGTTSTAFDENGVGTASPADFNFRRGGGAIAILRSGGITPAANGVQSLGETALRWGNLWLADTATNFITSLVDVGAADNADLLPIVDVSTAQLKFVSANNLPGGGGGDPNGPGMLDFNLNQFDTNTVVDIISGAALTNIVMRGMTYGEDSTYDVGTATVRARTNYADTFTAQNINSSANLTISPFDTLTWLFGSVSISPASQLGGDVGAPLFMVRSNWNMTVYATNAIIKTSLQFPDYTASRVAIFNAESALTNSATVDTTELGYLDGVTSAIQTQLNGKMNGQTNNNHFAASTTLAIKSAALLTNAVMRGSSWPAITASRAAAFNASGNLTNANTVTLAELEFLGNVTSDVQGQLNGKMNGVTNANQFGASTTLTIKTAPLFTNSVMRGSSWPNLTADRAAAINASGNLTNANTVTLAELEFLGNVTSDIQAQFDTKVSTNHNTALGTNFITGVADVGTPASGDLIPIVDISTAERKFVSIANLPGGGGGDPNGPGMLDFNLNQFNTNSVVDIASGALLTNFVTYTSNRVVGTVSAHRFTGVTNKFQQRRDLTGKVNEFSANSYRTNLSRYGMTRNRSTNQLDTAGVDNSGAAYYPSNNTFFTIRNNSPRNIQEFRLDGTKVRTITTSGNWLDPEGICYLYDDLFAIIDEDQSVISVFHITPTTTNIDKEDDCAHFDTGFGNLDSPGVGGMEGVTYDPIRHRFITVEERGAGTEGTAGSAEEMEVYLVPLPDESAWIWGGPTSNDVSTVTTKVTWNVPNVLTNVGVFDLSDCYYDPASDILYLLSHTGDRIVGVNADSGTIKSVRTMAEIGGEGFFQPEGLTFSPDMEKMIVVGEPDMFGVFSIMDEGDFDTKSFTLEDPVVNDEFTIFYTERAIRLKKMVSVIEGGTSAVFTIRYDSSRAATGTAVVTGGTTTSSTTTGTTTRTFNAQNIPANSFVWIEYGTVTGTVNEHHVTLFFE